MIKHIATVLAVAILYCPLVAQTINQSDTLKPGTLQEVVIAANKDPETRKTIAQQVTILRTSDMLQLQAQSTADLLANSGTVFVQKSQQGGGSPVLRGFEASRILLVVDGVRMNNLIYRSGHLQNVITLDNNALERVEVIFGPSSSIYGSDALGGVVHLFTKKAEFSEEANKKLVKAQAFARYGAVNQEQTYHAEFNLGGKRWASFTSFNFSDFGDLLGGKNQNPFYAKPYGERPFYAKRIDGQDSLVKNADRFLQVGSAYSQIDLIQKIAFKAKEKSIHSINLQYSNSGDVPRYDRLTDPAGSGLRFAEWYYGPQKRILAAYDWNHQFNRGFFQSFHLGTNYQNVEESRHTRRFGNSTRTSRIENVQVGGLNAEFKHASKKHVWRIGLDGQFNDLRSTAFNQNIDSGEKSPVDTRYPDGKNQMINVALFSSHTWKLNESLILNNAFRLGVASLQSEIKDTSFFRLPYSSVNQNNVVYSGSIGLIHLTSESLKISLNASSGFRVPNVDDLSKIFDSAPGDLIVPNPSLKPEKTLNIELGVTRFWGKSSSWETYLYSTRFVDAIVTDNFLFNGQDSFFYDGQMSRVLANQNKRNAYLYGFSTQLRSQVTEHFSTVLAMNYTYGRIKTDSSDVPLDHIPPFQVRLQLRYQIGRVASDFFVNYNGWKRLSDYQLGGEDNEAYATPEGMPAWLTANFRITVSLMKQLKLHAGIDNILDTQYRVFASGINGPGRNVFVGLRLVY